MVYPCFRVSSVQIFHTTDDIIYFITILRITVVKDLFQIMTILTTKTKCASNTFYLSLVKSLCSCFMQAIGGCIDRWEENNSIKKLQMEMKLIDPW